MQLPKVLAGAVAVMIGAAAGAAPAETVIARTGGITLSQQSVRELIDQADPGTRAQLAEDPVLLSQFVRGRLARMAILAEAKAKKWEQNPDIVQRIEQARNEVIIETFIAANAKVPAGYPAEPDLQAAYEANRAKFLRPRQYRIAQIFIAVPIGAAKAEDDKARSKVVEMQNQVRTGKTAFADLAKRTAPDGGAVPRSGDLDWLPEDRLLPQIRDAVSGMETGGISEPVRSADGWHLLQLVDTRPAAVAPLAEVRQELAEALRQQKAADAASQFVSDFLRRNPVQLDEIALSKLLQK